MINQSAILNEGVDSGLPVIFTSFDVANFGTVNKSIERQNTSFIQNTVNGYYSFNSKAADVLYKARGSIFDINNKLLKKNVRDFLDVFVKELNYLDTAPNVFPKINIEVEDDNIFFEWIFNADFRIGFTIVDDNKDSSWFLFLQNENVTGSFSGNFEHVGYQFVIRKLLKIVLENT